MPAIMAVNAADKLSSSSTFAAMQSASRACVAAKRCSSVKCADFGAGLG